MSDLTCLSVSVAVLKIQEFRKPFRAMLSKHLANLEEALTKGKTLDPTMLYCVDWKAIRTQIMKANEKCQVLSCFACSVCVLERGRQRVVAVVMEVLRALSHSLYK